ncbi:unnamed protein product, partial [Staurois parvus]
VKLSLEPYKRESPHFITPLPNEGVGSLSSRTDVETEKQWQLQQQAANKDGWNADRNTLRQREAANRTEHHQHLCNIVGIVPPRTKSPSDEGSVTKQLVVIRGGNHASNGQISR